MSKLTATQVKYAKTEEGGKVTKYFDGGGLYFEVFANATDTTGRYWRYKYRFAGRERRLAIGTYPDISLSEARQLHLQARALLAKGIDPIENKLQQRSQQTAEQQFSFKAVADEFLNLNPRNLKAITIRTARNRLERYAYPLIGQQPVMQITTPDMLTMLRRIERQGKLETASRLKNLCSRVFRYAISCGIIDRDPTADLAGAIKTPKVQHMPALTDPQELAELMRDIKSYSSLLSRSALLLAAYTLLRNRELRMTQWKDIDLDAGLWKVPARKMKGGQYGHVVPLSCQAIEVLQELNQLPMHSDYVFSEGRKPMSENTPNKALHKMGYKGRHCLHGFRSSFSTRMNEAGKDPDVVEACLAHAPSNKVRAAYNRAEYIQARRELLQYWADYLEGLQG